MDVTLVWTGVQDLNVFFKTVEFAIVLGGEETRLDLWCANPKATQSAFTTQEDTFDGEEATHLEPTAEDTDASDTDTTAAAIDADMPKKKKRKPNPKSSNQKASG